MYSNPFVNSPSFRGQWSSPAPGTTKSPFIIRRPAGKLWPLLSSLTQTSGGNIPAVLSQDNERTHFVAGKLTRLGDSTPVFEAGGVAIDSDGHNTCTSYAWPGEDQYGPELSSGTTVVGKVYEITAHSVVDFVSAGAANNNVGTKYTNTIAQTMTALDKVKEIGGTNLSSGAFVSGLGLGAQSAPSASAIPSMTVSGAGSPVLKIVSDAADLIAAGLDIAGTKVYELSTGAGGTGTVVISGTASGGVPRAMSVWAKLVGGTGTLNTNAGTHAVAISSAGYTRATSANIPMGDGPLSLAITCAASSAVRFLIPQLEGMSHVGPEILTHGVSVTRDPALLSIPISVIPNKVAVRFSADVLWDYIDGGVVFDATDSEVTHEMTLSASSTGVVLNHQGDQTSSVAVFNTLVPNTEYHIEWGQIVDGTLFLTVNGVAGEIVGGNYAEPMMWGTALALGCLADGSQSYGVQIKNFRIR